MVFALWNWSHLELILKQPFGLNNYAGCDWSLSCLRSSALMLILSANLITNRSDFGIKPTHVIGLNRRLGIPIPVILRGNVLFESCLVIRVIFQKVPRYTSWSLSRGDYANFEIMYHCQSNRYFQVYNQHSYRLGGQVEIRNSLWFL